jgi:hypothetical protein
LTKLSTYANIRAITSKQKTMKKIRDAYRAGLNDQEIAAEAGRARQIAYRAGQRVLAKEITRTNADNEALQTHKLAQFAEAKGHAVGSNAKVMALLEAASAVPHQRQSEPLWGSELHHQDGTQSIHWLTALHSGRDQDDSRPYKTPLLSGLDMLRIDSTDWSHNGLNFSVDNLHITAEAPIVSDETGGPTRIGAPRTKLYFNTRHYDPNNIAFDEAADPTGQVRIDLDEKGGIAYLGLSRSNFTGYAPEDPTKVQVDLDAFLDGALETVQQTAQAYRGLRDGLDTPPGM